MKKISILGSTGSIGTQALEVLDGLQNQDMFEVCALACNSNVEKFLNQIKKYRPKRAFINDFDSYKKLKAETSELLTKNGEKIEILTGRESFIQAATEDTDILLTATTGTVALDATLKAIDKKINIALANKETLVMAGEIVMKKAKEKNVKILPVDSEHSAILQASNGNFENINKILITASGGPFLNKTTAEINMATAKEALNHPNWSMGKKITIDSATLMNKGLEVIEAHHLFNMPYEKIKVVVHPESILHSAVETLDGSILAQLGYPSMHIPIQFALTYPNRIRGIKTESFNFFDKNLTFQPPDLKKFPCLKMAFEAGKRGGIYPCVLNAANEIAVYKFLRGKITIKEIIKIVEKALSEADEIKNPTLQDIFEADKKTRIKYA